VVEFIGLVREFLDWTLERESVSDFKVGDMFRHLTSLWFGGGLIVCEDISGQIRIKDERVSYIPGTP
jgi:hypothetical protein